MLNFIKQNKLGTLTIVVCLTYMFLGLPAQIIQTWRTHNIAGISILMFLLLALQSVCWVAYGIQKKDRFVIIANIFGSLFSIIIVLEYFIFR